MAKNLVIVESPAKANTIKKFLGKGYNVVASLGHIRDLPKSKLGVDPENNFEPHYINIRGKGPLIKSLKKEAAAVSKVYLATDHDREGEAISWHLSTILNLNPDDNIRITFNEITKGAVQNSIKECRPIDMDLVDSQQARRILDRLVGYKLSPILWKKVRKGLSAGRVQSVAVKIICDREEEIDKFIPEEYWTINAELNKTGYNNAFIGKYFGIDGKKKALKNKEETDKVLGLLEGQEYLVEKVTKKKTYKKPFAPFITSTLQQEAARRLGFTSKKTMAVAQQLYEGIKIPGIGSTGLITYMRTDSRRISTEAQDAAVQYITDKYGEKYLPKKVNVYSNKSASQDAHEAVRPTHVELSHLDIKESLSRDQYRLYKLIWERFMSSQMTKAEYDTVSVDIVAGKVLFKSKGETLIFNGFKKVYADVKDKDKDENIEAPNKKMPPLEDGDMLNCEKINSKQNFTQPPSRYTEASLVKIMEEKGIGRPSTYAPTISTILSRGYVIKDKKSLCPTELGGIVNTILQENFEEVVNVSFTANMEAKLDKVEEGNVNWKEILKEFYGPFEEKVNIAQEKLDKVEIPVIVTDVICEKCGKNMVKKMGRFGEFLACPGFPECRNTKAIVEEAGVLCPKCGKKVLIRKSRKGKKYIGCEGYPDCDFVGWDMPSDTICPKCGTFTTKKYYGPKIKITCANEECDFEELQDRKKKEDNGE